MADLWLFLEDLANRISAWYSRRAHLSWCRFVYRMWLLTSLLSATIYNENGATGSITGEAACLPMSTELGSCEVRTCWPHPCTDSGSAKIALSSGCQCQIWCIRHGICNCSSGIYIQIIQCLYLTFNLRLLRSLNICLCACQLSRFLCACQSAYIF